MASLQLARRSISKLLKKSHSSSSAAYHTCQTTSVVSPTVFRRALFDPKSLHHGSWLSSGPWSAISGPISLLDQKSSFSSSSSAAHGENKDLSKDPPSNQGEKEEGINGLSQEEREEPMSGRSLFLRVLGLLFLLAAVPWAVVIYPDFVLLMVVYWILFFR